MVHRNFRHVQRHRFGDNREVAIKRDGEKCVVCGMTRIKHKKLYQRDITVDHLDGRGCNTTKPLKNNNLNNLQTLCLSCHGKKDRARILKSKKLKITDQQAKEIREEYAQSSTSFAKLGAKFGVSGTYISLICHNINRREVRDARN